jgi:Family of unknown function (DUF5302)
VAAERGSQDSDDVRRKFREALDRKAERQHASAEGVERDGSHKSHGTRNRTQGRPFRRKTG